MNNRIFSIIGWIGTAAVAVAVVIWVLSITSYSTVARLDQYRFYFALVGLVCMLIYMVSQWREVGRMFSRRQARYGTLAASSVLIVLGILVAINYIGKQQNKRWDLTEAKQFSLSDQTRNVISNLDSPLHIMVFSQNTDFQPYQDRLKEYEYLSKQVSTEYIDPDQKQTVARQNQVTQYGTIIFQYKGRTERVTSNTEQEITNGIIKVVSGQQRKIYFTQGHGEKDPTNTDRLGYNGLSELLKRENYAVEKLVLAQAGAVPDDASVIVIAGPTLDFYPPEIDALKKYLDKQGKLLLGLDPPEKAEGPNFPNLVGLAHDWGFDIGNNVIVDASGMGQLFGQTPFTPIVATYPSHPINERFNANIMTMFPLARSVSAVSGGVNGHTPQPLVETSPRSWAEADLKGLYSEKEPEFTESADKRGPISIGAAVSASATPPDPSKPQDASAPKAETRLVVYGDSDFAANNFAGFSGNKDLFMNTIGWLSQQENLISVRPKEPADRRLTMTAAQQQLVGLFAWLILPLAVFGSGVYSWWRRR